MSAPAPLGNFDRCESGVFQQYRPKADMTVCAAHVRFRGKCGHDRLRESAFAVAIEGIADIRLCGAYVAF
jgi:hypothetical protein